MASPRLARVGGLAGRLAALLGIVIYAFVLWRVGLTRLLEALASVNPWLLGVSPLPALGMILFKGIKWRLVARSYGVHVTLRDACLLWCVGAIWGSFTPGQVGEAIKAPLLASRTKSPLWQCMSTIVVDKLCELGVLLLLAASALLFLKRRPASIPLALLLWAAAWFLIHALARNHTAWWPKSLLSPPASPQGLRQKLVSLVAQFFEGIHILGANKGRLTYVFLSTLGSWAMIFLVQYVIAIGMAMPLTFVSLLTLFPLISLVSVLPISVSGVGTRDAAAIFLFGRLGAQSETVVAWSLLGLSVQLAVIGGVGLVGWIILQPRKEEPALPNVPAAAKDADVPPSTLTSDPDSRP